MYGYKSQKTRDSCQVEFYTLTDDNSRYELTKKIPVESTVTTRLHCVNCSKNETFFFSKSQDGVVTVNIIP